MVASHDDTGTSPSASSSSKSTSRLHLIRAAALDGFVPILTESGVDASALLSAARIAPDLLEDPDALISYEAFLLALHRARVATGIPHFGLLLAERQPVSMLGPLGLAVLAAPDVRSAIGLVDRYLGGHVQGAATRLETRGDSTSWVFEVLPAHSLGVEVQDDLAVGMGMRILRQIAGDSWRPTAVTLVRPPPQDPAVYQRILGCEVRFGEEEVSLVFDTALLDRRLGAGKRELHRLFEGYLEEMAGRARREPGDEVRQVILQCMRSGRVSLEEVGGRFGVSPRTLQRLLAERGTTFQSELDEARCGLARRILEGKQVSLTSLAFMLDYSSPAAFSRAFKRVCGVSPSEWRMGQRAGD